jgi:hypothetical protein
MTVSPHLEVPAVYSAKPGREGRFRADAAPFRWRRFCLGQAGVRGIVARLTTKSRAKSAATQGGLPMTELTRRGAMALGAATIGASTLPLGAARAAVTDVPMADVKPPNFAVEKDATLRIRRS